MQYISLHPLASWAEYLRWHGLDHEDALSELRLPVWVMRLFLDEVHEVRYENASSFGLEPEDLVSDDWSACQAVGERLRTDHSAPKVLLTPSAALPGSQNLVILEPRVAMPYGFSPIDPVDVPVTLAAAGARPPKSLLSLVRFRGHSHPEFEAWKEGRSYQLVEPSDELLATGENDTQRSG